MLAKPKPHHSCLPLPLSLVFDSAGTQMWYSMHGGYNSSKQSLQGAGELQVLHWGPSCQLHPRDWTPEQGLLPGGPQLLLSSPVPVIRLNSCPAPSAPTPFQGHFSVGGLGAKKDYISGPLFTLQQSPPGIWGAGLFSSSLTHH